MSNRRQTIPGSAAKAQPTASRQGRVVIIAAIATAIVAALVLALALGNSSPTSATGSPADSVVATVAAVPPTIYDQVGRGAVTVLPKVANGTAITRNGLPEVLYIGAEYCPYCAAQRWALVSALSRFGTFSNIRLSASSGVDVFPDTATVTFHGSTFTSEYVAFTPVEAVSNVSDGKGGYEPLEKVTPDQQREWQTIDSRQSFPFVDFAGRYFTSGASFDPGVLKGKSADEIAAELGKPASPISQAVVGTANAITAAICAVNGGKPTAVCTSSAVAALLSSLPTSGAS